MLMYTSCGWFFDELSGIETTQVIQYAARTIQLYQKCSANPSNRRSSSDWSTPKATFLNIKDGRMIYEKFVTPRNGRSPESGGPLCFDFVV